MGEAHAISVHTTAQLLHAVRSGPDDPAWRLFTERYEPLLLAVSRRLGLDEDDAQDLAQQTLLEFVRDLRAGQFDRERGRMRTWVLAIARNRARDLLRRRARRGAALGGAEQGVTDGDGTADPASLDAELESAWELEAQRRIAREAFRRLREGGLLAERTVLAFELTVVRGVSVEAASVECGMTPEQVYVARSRVAAKLRAIIEQLEKAWAEESPWES